MPKPASSASLIQILRRGGEVLLGTRRHLAQAMIAHADRIERRKKEEAQRCGDIHRLGCACAILKEIDEP